MMSRYVLKNGRGRRIRTLDIWFWRPTLYQLNYTPVYCGLPKKEAPSKLNTNLAILSNLNWSSPRSISIGQLNTLPCLHLQPINLVIFKGSYSIKDGKSYLEGGFTLRCLQRLSVPYIATQLCSWSATGTPEVRPSRSSRTKDSSSQISCAHNG